MCVSVCVYIFTYIYIYIYIYNIYDVTPPSGILLRDGVCWSPILRRCPTGCGILGIRLPLSTF